MRLFRIAFALSTVALATCRDTFAAATEAIMGLGYRLADLALSLISPATPRLELVGAPSMALDQRGVALDPALRQSMRHEANVSRRSADRHT